MRMFRKPKPAAKSQSAAKTKGEPTVKSEPTVKADPKEATGAPSSAIKNSENSSISRSIDSKSNSRSMNSKSFRMEDGMLLEEINQLSLEGSDRVPSTDEYDESVIFPVPEVLDLETETEHETDEDEDSKPWDNFFRGPGKKKEIPGNTAYCKLSKYKQPASPVVIKEIMMPRSLRKPIEEVSGGLIWKANIVPDDFDKNFESNGTLEMCRVRDYDAKKKCIKPRRGNLLVKKSDFFESIVTFPDGDEYESNDELDIDIFEESTIVKNHWCFSGVLCGFPSLTTLEVIKIEYRRSPSLGNINPTWTTHWKSSKHDFKPMYPSKVEDLAEVRAVLRSPPYTTNGWAHDSRGYVFWFEGNGTREDGEDRVTYGSNIVRQFETERILSGKPSPKCVRVHMISHRYAVGNKQNIKDQFTYHSLALLEWDHGKYCTVVEVGYLGGLSGNSGRSNWIEDKMEPLNSLYKCLPPEMVHPWKTNLSEIRLTNVKSKNLEEHLEYMKRYTGQDKRFVDVKVTFSHVVRLTYSSRENIAQYLVNYISRDKTYSEIRSNCQTFAADFCAFLAGKKDVQPYHPINRMQYTNQTHHFIYDPSMYV